MNSKNVSFLLKRSLRLIVRPLTNYNRFLSLKSHENGKNKRIEGLCIDDYGNQSTMSFTKSEAVKELELLPRDLVYLNTNRSISPSFIVRKDCFLISMGKTVATVKKDKMFLFRNVESIFLVPKLVSIIIQETEESFESKVLDILLNTITKYYDNKLSLISPLVQNVLDNITQQKVNESLKRLLEMQNKVNEFSNEVEHCRDVIFEVLKDDDDLDLLVLSNLNAKSEKDEESHEEIEIILENYMSRLVNIVQDVHALSQRIENTKSVIELQLDSYRNKVLYANLMISTVALSLSLSTAITGIFGMNLVNGFENHPSMFTYVCVSTVGLVSVLGLYFWNLYIKDAPTKILTKGRIDSTIFNNLDNIEDILLIAIPTKTLTKEDFRKIYEAKTKQQISNGDLELIYSSFSLQEKTKEKPILKK